MKTIKIIVDFIKEEPKEFIEGFIGFALLFGIIFMMNVIGA